MSVSVSDGKSIGKILQIVFLHMSRSVSHGSYNIVSHVLVAELLLIEYGGIIFYHCFLLFLLEILLISADL